MRKIRNVFLFLLGFFACHNIFWIYKGNSASYIYIETLIAIPLLIFSKKGMLRKTYKDICFYIKMYWYYTVLLVPVGLLVFTGTKYAITPLKGIAAFIISFIYLLAIIVNVTRIKIIIKGFVCGATVNLIYTVLCYIFFKVGIQWRVIDLVAVDGDVSFENYLSIYRAQGFFMECSYYMCFIATSMPFVLYLIKNIYLKICVVLIVVFLGAISFSGNIINILLSILLYICLVDKKIIELKNVIRILIPSLFIIMIISDKLIDFLYNANFWDLLSDGLNDLNINNEDNNSNVTRLAGIKGALNIVLENPIGIGAGGSSPYMALIYGNLREVHTTFSFILKVLIESGWIGGIFYVLAIIKMTRKLIIGNSFHKAIAVSLICATIGQFVNGVGWFSFILFTLAMAVIYSNERMIQSTDYEKE